MSLYLRLGTYLVAVLACIGIGWHLGSLDPKRDLAALQAQDWQGKAQAAQVALAATEAQLKQAQTVSANNSTVIEALQNENAKITADRNTELVLARRLLNSAAPHPSASPTVLEAKGGQPTPTTSATSGDGPAASLLVDARDECLRNAAQLNSLIAEITPQL